MNIDLIRIEKEEKIDSKYLKEIVIVNYENMILFPVQIFQKEDGDFFCMLPKRNRKYENGNPTEYVEFSSLKDRTTFLNTIISKYKKNQFLSSIDEIEATSFSGNLKIDYKEIKNEYVKYLLTITIDKLKFKGFKMLEIDDKTICSSPNFVYEKDLHNRFKLTDLAKSMIIQNYIEYTFK